MDTLKIQLGKKVIYNDREALVVKIIDLSQIMIEEIDRNVIHTVLISELSPFQEKIKTQNEDYTLISDNNWKRAKFKFDIVSEVIESDIQSEKIKEISEREGIHLSTIYRWIKKFDKSGTIASLSNSHKKGGKGKSRLDSEQDKIINEIIISHYLDSSKKSIKSTIRKIHQKCIVMDVKRPHANTIRNRINNYNPEMKMKKRFGSQAAKYKYEPHKGSFPGANFPLSVVQIDHTKLDIILVDSQTRKPIHRPWITAAIDIYSRMLVGYYISFDPPGSVGTALCIANMISPKEQLLSKFDIDSEWPCWGSPKTIHLDNAKEFKSNTLIKSCENYGISIEYRPIGSPHFGGHIERLLGTFSTEIHELPGTTFSDISKRQNYSSEKNASLTIEEFEKWFLIYVTKVYHLKKHSTIKTSPLDMYKNGLLNNEDLNSTGLPPRIENTKKLEIDFMPIFERTVQEYGVVINHITYYSDVLRNYVHKTDSAGRKVKFIFRRDPRDISQVYFLDPTTNEYYNVPYRNMALPPMSIWEYNIVLKELTNRNKEVDEASIFAAYRDMEEIEKHAISKRRKLQKTKTKQKPRDNASKKETPSNAFEFLKNDIKPFEDIDYGTFE